MPTTDADVRSLHRYLIWSLNMRDHFYEAVEAQGEPLSDDNPIAWLMKPFMYLSLRFAILFTVVEGYAQLQLTDQSVDELLKSDHVELLRRYRNGAFHFQRDYFDLRFRNFLTEEAVEWAEKLESALSAYFLRWYEVRGLRVELVAEGET